MNRPNTVATPLLIAFLLTLASSGCQLQKLDRRYPLDSPSMPKPAAMSDLANRQLYTFCESDVDRYIKEIRNTYPELTDRIIHLGRKNIGQPYDIYLLGEFPYEYIDAEPIYCLHKSDCLVFCEHMFSMALSDNWWTFLNTLQRIRYNEGQVGMLTRNHFTVADWDQHNSYLFEDLTPKLGGGKACVPLTQTCRRARFFAKHNIGQDIPDQPINDSYIPKENVPSILSELHNGDFVNIIRGNKNSQYAGHTGLIAIADDGTVDFLHSTRPTVREQPLVDYVNTNRGCMGIKILRLRPGAEKIMAQKLASSPKATKITAQTLRAALAKNPTMSTGMPDGYADDWARAIHMQSYRIPYDAPLDQQLQAALEQADQTIATELNIPDQDRAFGVLDLTDQRLAMIQPDEMFYAASVPKICILLAYFETHPEAATNLDPTTRDELGRMIKVSDNAMAAKYGKLVTIDKVQEILQSKEYGFFNKDHGGGFWYGKHYSSDSPRIGDPIHDHSHGATVRQILRYYLMLEQGRLVSSKASATMKEIFASPQLEFANDRFVAGLNGRNASILRKSGMYQDWFLDTARVQHGDRLYLLAGMTHNANGHKYLEKMATAVDDILCGQTEKRQPFDHQLVMHTPDANLTAGKTYESTIVTPPAQSGHRFNEAVISWNIDTPPTSGFRVELRVGNNHNDSWSPWLFVADWGKNTPTGKVITKCDDGHIDVDFFRSDKRFDRLQYRITAYDPDKTREIHIDRIAVCLSDTTGMPVALRPNVPTPPQPAPDKWQRRLPVPFRTQATDNPDWAGTLCSPTSTSMVMEYRGVNKTVEEMAIRTLDERHGIFGNWPFAVQAAYTFGIPGYINRFSNWKDVERCIANGQPLVISIVAALGELRGAPYDYTKGHLIVLTGFDKDGNVEVNDPAVRKAKDGQITYQRSDLEKVWMTTKGGTAYVLLPKK